MLDNDLYQNFLSSAEGMDERKLLQVSMDGPSVNLKFLRLLQSERKKKDIQELLDIGTCGLHTIHDAYITGTEASGWEIKKTLKVAYTVLHESPARRDDYQSVTGSSKVPLGFCATRWIEDKPVADRFIELWPNLTMSNL